MEVDTWKILSSTQSKGWVGNSCVPWVDTETEVRWLGHCPFGSLIHHMLWAMEGTLLAYITGWECWLSSVGWMRFWGYVWVSPPKTVTWKSVINYSEIMTAFIWLSAVCIYICNGSTTIWSINTTEILITNLAFWKRIVDSGG